ncbi:MAG: LysM peptidoglycan-binding domain-containing protein [Steroidobacteraceae bacterium]
MLRAAPNDSSRRSPRTPILVAALTLGLTVAFASTVPAPASAQEASGQSMSVPLAPDAPETYVVKPGDTLWDIAGVFLKYPWYWPEIWYVNPQIANPHWIYPGDVLRLSWVDGKPRVTVDSAGDVRLSPQVRTDPLSQAIKAIPYDVLMTFVQRPSLLTEKQVDKGPYVVGFRDRHIVGAGVNEFYAKGLGKPAPGTEFSVVHPGVELRDPDDGDLLGYVGHYAATGRVITTTDAKHEESLTHLIPVDTGREIGQGDKLFPANAKFGEDFVPSAPPNTKLNGQVLAIVDGLAVAGKYQVLAINRGTRDGLKPGNVVAVYSRGVETSDFYSRGRDWTTYTANYDTVKLPDERSGTMLLFTVYDRISYGLVVESIGPMRIGDFIKHPDFGHDDAGTQNFGR